MVRRSIVIVSEKEVRAGPLRRRGWVELHGFLTIALVFQCPFFFITFPYHLFIGFPV